MYYGEYDHYSYKTLRSLHRISAERNAPVSTTEVWHANGDAWSRTKCMWEIRNLESKGFITKVSSNATRLYTHEMWKLSENGAKFLDEEAENQMAMWTQYLDLRRSKDETSTQ